MCVNVFDRLGVYWTPSSLSKTPFKRNEYQRCQGFQRCVDRCLMSGTAIFLVLCLSMSEWHCRVNSIDILLKYCRCLGFQRFFGYYLGWGALWCLLGFPFLSISRTQSCRPYILRARISEMLGIPGILCFPYAGFDSRGRWDEGKSTPPRKENGGGPPRNGKAEVEQIFKKIKARFEPVARPFSWRFPNTKSNRRRSGVDEVPPNGGPAPQRLHRPPIELFIIFRIHFISLPEARTLRRVLPHFYSVLLCFFSLMVALD